MLSPTMITSGKGERSCAAVSCCAVSYSSLSPVPLSPITAKVSDPFAAPGGTPDSARAGAGVASWGRATGADGAEAQANDSRTRAAITVAVRHPRDGGDADRGCPSQAVATGSLV